MDGLGLERFALFGVSQGAAAAIAHVAAHPGRVSRIVLHGAYAQGRNRRGSDSERGLARAFLALTHQGWGDEHSAFVRAFASVFFPAATPEQLRSWVGSQRPATSAETAVRLRAALDEIDVAGLLGAVRAPTLVLHSRYDNVAPLDQGRRIAAGNPGARFVELESDNRVILEGEPACPRFVTEVERFLTAWSAKPRAGGRRADGRRKGAEATHDFRKASTVAAESAVRHGRFVLKKNGDAASGTRRG